LNKKIIFVALYTLIAILLFSTALTCNMCGLPLQVDNATKNTGKKDYNSGNENVSNPNSGPESIKQSSDNKEQQPNNSAPVIENLKVAGINIKFAEASGYFKDLPSAEMQGSTIIINIEAYDKDGDELSYLSYDSLGNSFIVKKINSSHAELTWIVPAHTGSYSLTLEVSDGKGGKDSYTAEMNFK